MLVRITDVETLQVLQMFKIPITILNKFDAKIMRKGIIETRKYYHSIDGFNFIYNNIYKDTVTYNYDPSDIETLQNNALVKLIL
jgi:hypothetical protein